MPTPSERRALLFVAAVAALGLGVRGLRSAGAGQGAAPGAAPGAALAAQLAAVDSVVAAGGRPRRPRAASPERRPRTTPAVTEGRQAPRAAPTTERAHTPPEPVDVDRADVAELDRLPGIGPALAQRIVDDRRLRGPFGNIDRLQDVRGIGPALAARLAPLVTFSGPPRAAAASKAPRSGLHP